MASSTRWLALLLCTALLALAGACSEAESLGDEPVTTVAVGSPPTWANGVGTLMSLKCGVCHQVPAAPLSPVGTPQTFDLNYHVTSPSGVPGAMSATVLNAINGGILSGTLPGSGQMPPEYATPLSSSELNALIGWSGMGGP